MPMFEEYYREVQGTFSKIKDGMSLMVMSADLADWSQYATSSKEVTELFDYAQEMLKQLDIELFSFGKMEKFEKRAVLSKCKESLLSLKSEYNTLCFSTQKQELLRSNSGIDKLRTVAVTERYPYTPMILDDEKLNVLLFLQRITKQREVIARSFQTVEETYHVGVEIHEELKDHRDRIGHNIELVSIAW